MTNLTLKARERFADDRYATDATGVAIDLVEPGRARCSLAVGPRHRNALGGVMGGVMFTLADLAFAAAANADAIAGGSTLAWVSLSSDIHFLAQPKGTRLLAEASCVKQGRSTCLFHISIHDDRDIPVAIVTTTGMKTI